MPRFLLSLEWDILEGFHFSFVKKFFFVQLYLDFPHKERREKLSELGLYKFIN